jgi:hypothetical protein
MEEAGFLTFEYPKVPCGEVSSLVPSPWFAEKVAEYAVSLADFGRHPGEEVLILTCNTRSWTGMGERTTKRERIDYTDTAETRRYREEARRLNAARVPVTVGTSRPITIFSLGLLKSDCRFLARFSPRAVAVPGAQ